MKALDDFFDLNSEEKALLSLAVLLDGFEASIFVAIDSKKGDMFEQIANKLCQIKPDVRLPLLGTFLRDSVFEEEDKE